ncbi:amidophosphoribosyltransferase [candidate division KSB1 bacterium]|nr:amidophosphoribosyltransferase [candidate division KSB1 bacterium]NIR72142.1 amidophosphoribosyltransferase [candidate division KSB1 bacterium]NIS26607.1 amidophosphoribosyltransferase [candidate division KSB1 bacterium]NIT73375.1 amidophosphoribosyltransferase [candidate division KSB1 bacterium]NIU27223.1 amidophosphoribosyltransferase [candidate division KSB1 bacterium]
MHAINKQVDKPKSNCGVVGVFGHPDASIFAYQALYALQHRGQESSGIVSSDGEKVYRHLGMGLVNDAFSDISILKGLKGQLAVGHNRYSTTGSTMLHNAQPFLVNFKEGPLAISHNGNFVNSKSVRSRLVADGSIFQTTSDTEVVLHLMARSREETIVKRIRDAFAQLKGAYSMVLLTRESIIGIRDPRGWRPICLGRKDGAHFIVSESCALDLIGAEYLREIEPGEIVIIDKSGVNSYWLEEQVERKACIFEYVYFSRPDSKIFDENVDKARRKLGKNLALEHPVDADIVIAVPDSSNTAALGYANRSGIKFEIGLIRNHYVGRTFIHPDQSERDFKVRVKFNPVEGVLKGRRVVVVDDSIVRGTTLKQLTKMLRKAGAKEVHVRVSSPPIISPCFYGMDFPTMDELIASNKTIEEIRKYLGVDSLGYLSLEGMVDAVSNDQKGFCTACFTGDYPLPPEEASNKLKYEDAGTISNNTY